MKYFYFFSFLLFLISIIQINSDKYSCPAGTFGENCNETCLCQSWSSSNICSLIEGRCLDCKFGHFGKKCEDICRPECKTNLCCAIKDKHFKKSKKTIKSNVSVFKIHIGNYTLNIETDYNRGYPLTIFQKSLDESVKENIKSQLKNEIGVKSYSFSNYQIKGTAYNNSVVYIGDDNKNLKLDLEIVMDELNGNDNKTINGIIGLGFLNSINERLFGDHNISLNIASYEIKDEIVSILFGDLFKNEKKYVHKLSYCEALIKEDIDSNIMKCSVDGIKGKSHSDALELDNINIEFSLNQNSSFVLDNIDRYKDYIKKYYFDDSNYKEIYNNESKITYYCFKHSKINRLTNFGFVINKYYYSYKANKFFIENSDDCEKGYSKFIIEFNNETVGLTFGKNMFKDLEITIDNEERKIYFYTKNVEYFSGDFVKEFTSSPSLVSNPFIISLICVISILLLNILSFLLYFYFKRKKEKTN